MTSQVLLTDLIDEFFDSIENGQPRLVISRNFNRLTPFLSPIELQGMRELWGHFDNPNQAIYPNVFKDTVDFLHQRYKNIKVFI